MTALRPSERLTVATLVALSAAVAVFQPAGAAPRLLLLAALLAAVLLLTRARGGAPGLVRDFFPVLVVLAVFSILQPVIEASNPRRYDALFAAADQRWLGPLVEAWRAAFGRAPVFTDAVYLVYASYYLYPVAICTAARRRGPASLERAIFPLLLAYYLSFVGYFLWPTSGPRVPAAREAALGGGAAADAVRAFLRSFESTSLDAFPSGHTAITLVAAVVGARLHPRAAPLLAAWAAAIVFSTVYVHVHYAVDVLGGLALAALTLLVAARLARLLGAAPGPDA
jgi:membrane-associated phospholipid phosphatase